MWISNTPKEVDLFTVPTLIHQSPQEAYLKYCNWRSQFVEGEPKPSDTYTVAELKKAGMIGLYEMVDESFILENKGKSRSKIMREWFKSKV